MAWRPTASWGPAHRRWRRRGRSGASGLSASHWSLHSTGRLSFQRDLFQIFVHEINQLHDGKIALIAADFGEKLREGQGGVKMLLDGGSQHHRIQRLQTQFSEKKRAGSDRPRVIPVLAEFLESSEHVFLNFLASRLHAVISTPGFTSWAVLARVRILFVCSNNAKLSSTLGTTSYLET